MDIVTINRLVSELPPPPVSGGIVARREACVKRFARVYAKLTFGASYARTLLEYDLKFPMWLEPEDNYWLREYYDYYRGYDSDAITSILTLREPEMTVPRSIIEAMLMDQNSSINYIAERTGWDEKILSGYEKLFFNIRDRFKDHLFVAQVAYPGGRLVETYSEYLDNEDFSMLLRKTGHNNGVEDVAYMAGLKTNLLNDMSSASAPLKLESTIMANGLLLARNGWLHDSRSEVIRSSRMLLTAAKQGNEKNNEVDPFVAASTVLAGELMKAKKKEAIEALTYQNKINEATTDLIPG